MELYGLQIIHALDQDSQRIDSGIPGMGRIELDRLDQIDGRLQPDLDFVNMHIHTHLPLRS